MSSVNKTQDERLRSILKEYSELPEYSGLKSPDIDSKSLHGDFPINIAATRGIEMEINTLLESGADINSSGEHRYTPLHNAVEQGHFNVVVILIENGADKSLQNDDGCTPEQLATLLEESEILDLLKKWRTED